MRSSISLEVILVILGDLEEHVPEEASVNFMMLAL
jgi:hypothetical protein